MPWNSAYSIRPILPHRSCRLKAAEPEEIHGLDLDGFVTSGFLAMLKEVLPQIIAIQHQHNLPEITLAGTSCCFSMTMPSFTTSNRSIHTACDPPAYPNQSNTGHSLGGSMSLLVATYLGHVYPSLQINVMAFGSPNVGDETFMKAFKKDVRTVVHVGRVLLSVVTSPVHPNFHRPYVQINVRQLSYVGSGLRGNLKIDPTSYGVGDMVSQMPPDCIAVSRTYHFLALVALSHVSASIFGQNLRRSHLTSFLVYPAHI